MQNKIIFNTILFLSLSIFVNAQTEKPTRENALAKINKCAVERTEFNCNEDNAQFLINLYEKGDKNLIDPLLNAGLNSDAALSELLGAFYANLLVNKTTTFINALSKRNTADQIYLSKMAFLADGSGNSPEWEIKVKEKLNKIINSKNTRSSSVAKTVAKQLVEYTANKEN